MTDVHYQIISPLRDDVNAILEQLNAHHLTYCSPDFCHLATAEELSQSDCTMIGAFYDDHLCGTGVIKFMGSYGEITRMFVEEKHRRKGIANRILDLLLEFAKERHLNSFKLETSEHFRNAVQLYISRGFVACEPFGEYVYAPFNSYMELNIAGD